MKMHANILEEDDKAKLDALVDKTRVFHSRVIKTRKIFPKPDKSDGFKDVSQEKQLLEILKNSCEISEAILAQFKISDAIPHAADDVHGCNQDPDASDVNQVALCCEELFRQPDGSLKNDVDFLKNKANKVLESLENLRGDMILISGHERLVDKHDNWWKDIYRQAERAESIYHSMEARRDASRKALVTVLVLLGTFRNEMFKVFGSNVSP